MDLDIAIVVVGALVVALSSTLQTRSRRMLARSIPGAEVAIDGGGAGAVREWMPIIISLAVLAAALYIVLNKTFDADTVKWAFGIVGAIVGYWLPKNT